MHVAFLNISIASDQASSWMIVTFHLTITLNCQARKGAEKNAYMPTHPETETHTKPTAI